MKQRMTLLGLLTLGTLLLFLSACSGLHHPHHRSQCSNCNMTKGAPADDAGQAALRHDQLYLCNCGPECKCNSISTQPGNCACGHPLQGYHVVKTEKDEALLCTCGADCLCALDPTDHSKCSCGKPIKRVSLKGTGLYFCNCGHACTCNHLATEPEECSKCGMNLIKAD